MHKRAGVLEVALRDSYVCPWLAREENGELAMSLRKQLKQNLPT